MEYSCSRWTTFDRVKGGVRVELNTILIDGFATSIIMGRMTIEQVPIPYKEAVRKK